MEKAKNYKGIYFMLLAALGFSIMGGFAKQLRDSFSAAQLVFYRNLVGFLVLSISLIRFPVHQSGGKLGLLIFRGIMGTLALYSLLFLILHIPLGTAMTYNTTNTFYIALMSFFLLKERLHTLGWICIVAGFAGILLIYRPSVDFNWSYHLIGILHGIFSAFAYLSIGRLNKYYDSRIIVLSFLLSGLFIPLLSWVIGGLFSIPNDPLFFTSFKLPEGRDWFYILGLGVFALLGQYFVTKAYSNDKAGIISAVGYSNIILGVAIGIVLGDQFPDLLGIIGVLIVISSGVTISLTKKA